MTQNDDLDFRVDQDPTNVTPGPSLRELATTEEASEPGLPGALTTVVLEDGVTFQVTTTNRDYLRWDKTPPSRRGGVKGFQDAPFIFGTFLAWSAAVREGLTVLSFDAFADQAVHVTRAKAEVPPTP